MLPPRSAEARVRAERYDVSGDLKVSSKTIGTSITYLLNTKNVSKSGMLLAWDRKSVVPFIENTILEMTIDPDGTFLKEPVHCLGKVVRKVDPRGESKSDVQFGVRIVQMDNEELEQWSSCIESIADRAGLDITDDRVNLLMSETESKNRKRRVA